MRIWAAVRMIGLIVLLRVVTAQAQQERAIPFCAGYWPLINDTRNAISDTNHGSVVGSAVFTDEALLLNGTDSYVDFGSAFNLSGSFSVSLFLKPATNDGLMRVLGKFQVADNNRDYCMFLNCGQRLWVFLSQDGTAQQGASLLQTTLLPAAVDGEWHHLALTWDSSAGSGGIRVYADGDLLATTNAQVSEVSSVHAGTASLTVGAYDVEQMEELVNPFKGSICQVALFRGVLDQADAALLADSGRLQDAITVLGLDAEEAADPVRIVMPSSYSSIPEAVTVVAETRPDEALESAVTNRTPPVVSVSRTIYVDERCGNDSFSGRASFMLGGNGPKKTVRGGLATVDAGENLVIREGSYMEDLNVSGRSIQVRFEGNVNLAGVKMVVVPSTIGTPVSDSTNSPGGSGTNRMSRSNS